MAKTTAEVVLITAATSVAAGTTKASPVTGTTQDVSANDGGDVHWRVKNGSSAPGAAGKITLQATTKTSPAAGDWYDYYEVQGDSAANSDTSGTFWLDKGITKVRGIAWGNTTNAVTVDLILSIVVP